jgi:hypothetical protein
MSSVTEAITPSLGKQDEMHLREERQVLVNGVTAHVGTRIDLAGYADLDSFHFNGGNCRLSFCK